MADRLLLPHNLSRDSVVTLEASGVKSLAHLWMLVLVLSCWCIKA